MRLSLRLIDYPSLLAPRHDSVQEEVEANVNVNVNMKKKQTHSLTAIA